MSAHLLFIAHRLLRAKQRHKLASTTSWVSAIGLTIGLTVLITVSSVMNGLDVEVRQQLFEQVEHVLLYQPLDTLNPDMQRLTTHPLVEAAAPFLDGQGLLVSGEHYQPVELKGIDVDLELQVNARLKQGLSHMATPALGEYKAFIGQRLAWQLQVGVGDKITLILPTFNHSILGVEPRFKRLEVAGIFDYDQRFSQDQNRVFIDYHDWETLFSPSSFSSGYRLKVASDVSDAYLVERLKQDFPRANLIHWSDRYAALFQTLQIQKRVFMIVVFLMVVMAVFYSVSSLVVLVSEKQTDIALFRSLGMTRRQVMYVFLIQGSMLSIVGVCCGVSGGLLLSIYVTPLSAWIEQLLGIELIHKASFMLDHIPSVIVWQDVIWMVFATIGMILLSMIYPALCASKHEPAGLLAHD